MPCPKVLTCRLQHIDMLLLSDAAIESRMREQKGTDVPVCASSSSSCMVRRLMGCTKNSQNTTGTHTAACMYAG